MNLKRWTYFFHEIGTIMYVGGILSHIVIGVILATHDAETMYLVYLYKMKSAYILILPGLAIKIICDLTLYFIFKEYANWLKFKLLMTAFLAINAFVFLVPMMPELVQLAKESIPNGEVSQNFINKEKTEMLIGQTNIIPLALELILGSFKPKLFGERKVANE